MVVHDEWMIFGVPPWIGNLHIHHYPSVSVFDDHVKFLQRFYLCGYSFSWQAVDWAAGCQDVLARSVQFLRVRRRKLGKRWTILGLSGRCSGQFCAHPPELDGWCLHWPASLRFWLTVTWNMSKYFSWCHGRSTCLCKKVASPEKQKAGQLFQLFWCNSQAYQAAPRVLRVLVMSCRVLNQCFSCSRPFKY
jgi:hypothetical protein